MLLASSRAFRITPFANLSAVCCKRSVLLWGRLETYVPSITSIRRSGSEGMMIQRIT